MENQPEENTTELAPTLPRAYIANGLGFDTPGRYWYYEVYIPYLSQFVTPLDPWDQPTVPGPEPEWWKGGHTDELLIDSSDMVIAQLDGPVIDSGTASEIGYGYAKGKVIHALRTDFRSMADLDSPINLQVYYWIRASGGQLVNSLEELGAILAKD